MKVSLLCTFLSQLGFCSLFLSFVHTKTCFYGHPVDYIVNCWILGLPCHEKFSHYCRISVGVFYSLVRYLLMFRTPGRNRRMQRFIRATLTLALTISFPAVQPDIFTLFINRPTKYL